MCREDKRIGPAVRQRDAGRGHFHGALLEALGRAFALWSSTQDREIAMAAVRSSGAALRLAPKTPTQDHLVTDLELGNVPSYVAPHFRKDREVVLGAQLLTYPLQSFVEPLQQVGCCLQLRPGAPSYQNKGTQCLQPLHTACEACIACVAEGFAFCPR